MAESHEIKDPLETAKNAFNNSTPIKITDQKEPWSEYDLDDGAKLRIKPVVIEVRKADEKGPDGNYLYHVKANLIIDVQQAYKKDTPVKGESGNVQ